MVESRGGRKTAPNPQRTDTIIRAVIVVLVSAVIGTGLLLGYSVWQGRKIESSSTPAQRALAGLRDLVIKNPSSAAARVRYAEALAGAGIYPEAIEQLQAAIKLDEKHSGAWLDLGLIGMQTDDRKGAERAFNKVIELTAGSEYEGINTRRELAFYYLGEIALDKKEYEEAVGYFKATLRIKRDSSSAYYMLAQALHGLGNDNAALKELDAALAFDTNYPEAHFLYGSILLEQGDKINAAVHLVTAADLAPERPEPQELLRQLGTADEAIAQAKSKLAAKQYQPAIESVLLARALDTESVEAAVLHAQILNAMGDKKAAKKVLAEAEKLDADNTEVKKLRVLLGK